MGSQMAYGALETRPASFRTRRIQPRRREGPESICFLYNGPNELQSFYVEPSSYVAIGDLQGGPREAPSALRQPHPLGGSLSPETEPTRV